MTETNFYYDGRGIGYYTLHHCPSNSTLAVIYEKSVDDEFVVHAPRQEIKDSILAATSSTDTVTLDALGTQLSTLGAEVDLELDQPAECGCKLYYPDSPGAKL